MIFLCTRLRIEIHVLCINSNLVEIPFKFFLKNLKMLLILLDHPKPMAVCTYGGKRIGGIFITDRSKFLTRKVMKIAISSAGLQRIQPSLQTNTGIQEILLLYVVLTYF